MRMAIRIAMRIAYQIRVSQYVLLCGFGPDLKAGLRQEGMGYF
jgi:hypothetical protein